MGYISEKQFRQTFSLIKRMLKEFKSISIADLYGIIEEKSKSQTIFDKAMLIFGCAIEQLAVAGLIHQINETKIASDLRNVQIEPTIEGQKWLDSKEPFKTYVERIDDEDAKARIMMISSVAQGETLQDQVGKYPLSRIHRAARIGKEVLDKLNKVTP